jgi:hypothetical protein
MDMLNENLSSRYYLFSISNFIAAIGGGLILGKCASVIDYPGLKGSSIFAFFIGAILGLIFLQFIPKKLSKSLAKSFSIGCGITSFILYYIYKDFSLHDTLAGNPALIFFALLCVRFSFWFYSRVTRVSKSAEHKQSIAWTEFGYYIGMVLGLVVWQLLGLEIDLKTALIIDIIFQFTAGLIDLYSFSLESSLTKSTSEEASAPDERVSFKTNTLWCWRLAVAVIFTTIGVQVTIFHAAHYVTEVFSSYILATFYSGVAFAAFIFSKYRLHVSWDDISGVATIASKINHHWQLNYLALFAVPAISVMLILFQIYHSLTSFNSFYVCILVFISAFMYEIISISLLDSIGSEEKASNSSSMLMKTYGLMSVGAAIGFWTLGLANNSFENSWILTIITLFCASSSVIKRKNQATSYIGT